MVSRNITLVPALGLRIGPAYETGLSAGMRRERVPPQRRKKERKKGRKEEREEERKKGLICKKEKTAKQKYYFLPLLVFVLISNKKSICNTPRRQCNTGRPLERFW